MLGRSLILDLCERMVMHGCLSVFGPVMICSTILRMHHFPCTMMVRIVSNSTNKTKQDEVHLQKMMNV